MIVIRVVVPIGKAHALSRDGWFVDERKRFLNCRHVLLVCATDRERDEALHRLRRYTRIDSLGECLG